MLTDKEIADIEERADGAANNREFRGVDCQEAWQVVTMDIPALLADRAELQAKAVRAKAIVQRWRELLDEMVLECVSLYAENEMLTKRRDHWRKENSVNLDRIEEAREERGRLQEEVERLKDALKTHEDFDPLWQKAIMEYAAERDQLQAENEALKNALKYVSSSCTTCKHFGLNAPCEKCVGKNFSEYVFNYDRFKKDGDGDA